MSSDRIGSKRSSKLYTHLVQPQRIAVVAMKLTGDAEIANSIVWRKVNHLLHGEVVSQIFRLGPPQLP